MSVQILDIILVVFIAISILIGIYRGFVKEILSITAWTLAFIVAWRYGEQAKRFVSPYISQEPLDLAVAYVAVFLITLITLSVISYIISQLFASTGMTGLDRSLGSIFGVIRAAVIIAILILVGRFMAMDQQQWWTDSQMLPYFEPLVEWLKSFLPEDIIRKIEA